MPFIGKKEIEQIKSELKERVKNYLIKNYKDPYGNPISTIERIGIGIEFDENESERDRVIISEIRITATVWIKNERHDTVSNSHLDKKNNIPLILNYNEESTEYDMENFNERTDDNDGS